MTGLFEVLCEILHIYNMYPFDVIVAKNGAKSVCCIFKSENCFQNSSICLKLLNQCRKSIALAAAYEPYTQICQRVCMYSRDSAVAMVTT